MEQHKRLAMGQDIGVESIPNPFKQVSNVDKSDGKNCCMPDGKRNGSQEQDISPGPQKFGRFQS
jgi:hypothetical protein